jgi:diadenosine tetraphosphatase ApaH/serine/threonine PP2A family protein phosphatase
VVVRRALRRVWGAADVGAERAFAEDAAARYGERYESVRKYRRWFEGAAADFLQRAGAGAGARRADGGRLRAGEAE